MSFLENPGNGNENWQSVRRKGICTPRYFPCPKQGTAPGQDETGIPVDSSSRDEYLSISQNFFYFK